MTLISLLITYIVEYINLKMDENNTNYNQEDESVNDVQDGENFINDGLNDDKKLIYEEEAGFTNNNQMFNEEDQDNAIYEVEFKIFNKTQKNVIKGD